MTALSACIVAVFLIAYVWLWRRASRRRRGSAGGHDRERLRQDLRRKVMYDEEKIDRLIDFEKQELLRKGMPAETSEELMRRAIMRWERDNQSAAPLY